MFGWFFTASSGSSGSATGRIGTVKLETKGDHDMSSVKNRMKRFLSHLKKPELTTEEAHLLDKRVLQEMEAELEETTEQIQSRREKISLELSKTPQFSACDDATEVDQRIREIRSLLEEIDLLEKQ
ncbi:hypothetical protein KEM55_004921, partial [Ascosphaera atra]